MQNLKQLIATENRHQIVLGVVFLLYIVSNVQIPEPLAEMVNTTIGNAIIIILALSMLAAANPIIGVLGLVAAYELLKRSGNTSMAIANLPSEANKLADMKQYNQFPKTLEEEIVNKMVPLVHHNSAYAEGSVNIQYQPVLDDTQNAAPINYEGVI